MFQVKGEILTDLAYFAHDHPNEYETLHDIIDDKVQFFEDTISLVLSGWEDEVTTQAADRDTATDQFTQLYEDEITEKRGDLDQIVTLVGDYIKSEFDGLKQAFCDVAEALALEIAQFQANKLARWNDRKGYELDRARHS